MPQSRTEQLLEELLETTKQNQRWLRVIARDNIEEAISSAFSEPWEYHLYEGIDGKSTFQELAEGLPCSDSTVGRRLNRWKQLGIVEQTSDGKYDKISSLETLGIELPELEDSNDE